MTNLHPFGIQCSAGGNRAIFSLLNWSSRKFLIRNDMRASGHCVSNANASCRMGWEQAVTCPSATDTGTKGIVTSKGLRRRRCPAKIAAGCEAPPPEEISTEREYCFLLPASTVWLRLLADYLPVLIN